MAVVITGCGGSSDSSTEGGGVTKAEFVKQANTICVKGEAQRSEAMAKVSATFDPTEDVTQTKKGDELIEAGMVVFEQTTEELADLEPPQGEEEKFEELIETREKDAAKVAQNPRGLLNGIAYLAPTEFMNAEMGLTSCLGGAGKVQE
jgi:hypothetical protein